jgi:predicted HAD superfamily phosphohydrolase YqeG
MPLYDLSVESLSGLPDLHDVAVLSDCDNTLFDPITGEMYADASDFLGKCGRMALVSANPDDELLEYRRELASAEVAVNSDRPVWNKATMFQTALRELNLERGSPVLVVGDRAVADVWVGRRVAMLAGLDVFGIRVQRPDVVSFGRADEAIRIGYGACRVALERAGQAQRFRPIDNSPTALVQYVDRRAS